MIPRPRIRIPIWLALAIVGAAYLVRSLFVRGGDFRLDATDMVVAALLLVAVAAVFRARSADNKEGESGTDSPSHVPCSPDDERR